MGIFLIFSTNIPESFIKIVRTVFEKNILGEGTTSPLLEGLNFSPLLVRSIAPLNLRAEFGLNPSSGLGCSDLYTHT